MQQASIAASALGKIAGLTAVCLAVLIATGPLLASDAEPGLPPLRSERLPLDFARSFQAGARDIAGQYMGGTELMRLVAFSGRLYAGNGFFMDKPYGKAKDGDPWTGAQVLVKDSAAANWRVERNLGAHYGRVDAMEVVHFSTDQVGRKLAVDLLMVAPSDWNEDRQQGRLATVWTCDPAGAWRLSVVERGTVAEPGLSARALGDHVDAVSGIHHVFAGVHNGLAGGRIYRGSYDPRDPARITWETTPEIATGGGRVTAFAEANGVLYATVGLVRDAAGTVHGGLFRRSDGPRAEWVRVWQWPYQADAPRLAADEWNNLRGLTAVPDPQGRGHAVLLAGHAYSGCIHRIDPRAQHRSEVEFNVRAYFAKEWGTSYEPGRKPAITGHNQFTRFEHPDTRESLWLVDVWVLRHLIRQTPPDNVAYYLVRHQDGRYEPYGTINDPLKPVPEGRTLAGTRTIEVSPFPEDHGRVLYFGGYDVTGLRGREHDTAWIYRGAVPEAGKTVR